VVWLLRAGVLVLLLGLWEWAGRAPLAFGFPTATATVVALGQLIASAALPAALAVSGRSFALGFGAALLVGIPLGLLMGVVRPLGRVGRVYLDLLIALPMVALVPLVILGFGVGVASSAFIVFLFSMPFVASNTHGGVRDVNPRLVEMARAFAGRPLQILGKIVWPSALPMVLAGVRYGLSRAFIGLVVAELLLAPVGLGRLIGDARSSFAFDQMFAAVLGVMGVAILLLAGVEQLEARLLHWRRP
jgi:NitT/TauT family transport system permease protein